MQNIKQTIPYNVLHPARHDPSWDGYHPIIEQVPVTMWNTITPWGHFEDWNCNNWEDWRGPSLVSGIDYLTRSVAGVIIKERAGLSGRICGIVHHKIGYHQLVFTMTGHPSEYFMLLDATVEVFIYKLGHFESVQDFFKHADPTPQIRNILPLAEGSRGSWVQKHLKCAFLRCGGNLEDLEKKMKDGTRWWDYFAQDRWLKQLVEHPDIARLIEEEQEAELHQKQNRL
ncbi:hypothetical protein B0H15DRAFT_841172 [Mycena belliarum]|uniref:Uncharacterized protein n=1 Tax=Mycena belliarum TaxID=1033014 RepID=A0AAD6U3B1_9AGAR|nr:hypothetical protein B0H15DRAFT_841172 [Mycena belliae]